MRSNVLLDRGYARWLLGAFPEARADLRASREIADELGFGHLLVETRHIEACIVREELGPVAAEPLLRACHEELHERGMEHLGAILVDPILARVLIELDRDEEAETLLDLVRRSVFIETAMQSRSIGAVLAARRGESDEALRLIAEAQEIAGRTDLLLVRTDVALDVAEVLRLAGRPDEALAAAESSLEMAERKEYVIAARRARAFLDALQTT
jgi:hypothetical protein